MVVPYALVPNEISGRQSKKHLPRKVQSATKGPTIGRNRRSIPSLVSHSPCIRHAQNFAHLAPRPSSATITLRRSSFPMRPTSETDTQRLIEMFKNNSTLLFCLMRLAVFDISKWVRRGSCARMIHAQHRQFPNRVNCGEKEKGSRAYREEKSANESNSGSRKRQVRTPLGHSSGVEMFGDDQRWRIVPREALK